jgi:DUF4097 and DUF4098 domain-containing protein YvlB
MRGLSTQGIALMALSLVATVVPAAAESRIVKDLDLQPNGRFTLESDLGSVTVTGAAKSGAHVVVTSDGRDLDSEIEVPTDTRVDVRTGGGGVILSGLHGSAEAKTSGGPIQVSGLNGNLEANTSGGPIHLSEVTGDAHAETSGGPISVEGLQGNLQAHTSGGGIRIDRVSGYVEAKTSGGSINANYSAGNRHGGIMETSGGHIEVAIDPSANLNVDASTSGGSVSSDLPLRVVGQIDHSNLHGSLGSGGEELRLRTSGGSIRIHAL